MASIAREVHGLGGIEAGFLAQVGPRIWRVLFRAASNDVIA